ncbi:MAG: ammonium transporter [candidate division NC10 bacterium]|nr:ammonium transporter [candidate division NC10 bacterium]
MILVPGIAFAEEAASKVALDTLWTLITAFLVMFMAAGFALLESGFCRSKNTVNILAKNFVVYAVTGIAFLVIGWGIMFGDGTWFMGLKGLWFLSGPDNSPATGDAYKGVYSSINWTGIPLEAKFLFQMVFAATAATIVSGAVAERIKFGSFFLFSVLMAGLLYPITGHWIWGGGWLAERGMWDFAGSTVVHSVGGWAALAGAIMLGPRLGKFTKDGRINPIPGHSLTSATLGVFILWFGWFGFNPGSTMGADWGAIGHIAATTNTAAAAAVIAATFTAWVLLGKPDLTMALNGGVAGLVAITAPCAFVSLGSSLAIGLVAGILVVLSVLFFDRIKVDDPVGAISAHLTCGVWGTLAVGLFAQDKFSPGTTGNGLFFGGGPELFQAQLIGVLAVGIFIFPASMVGWGLLKGLMGIRVGPEEEMEGLDISEHGLLAYPDFQIATAVRLHRGAPAPTPAVAAAAPEPVEAVRRPAAAFVPAGGVMRTPPRPGTFRTPPGPGQAEPVRGAPVAAAAPTTVAAAAPTTREQPFRIVVRGVDKRALREMWQRLCHEYPNTPQDFNEIYEHTPRFSDDAFSFKRGNPDQFRETVENLLYMHGIEGAVVTAER